MLDLPLIMILKKLVRRLRWSRSLHRLLGISLAFFVLVTGTSGVLLGWKKNVEILQPATHKGSGALLSDWIHLDRVSQIAQSAIDSVLQKTMTIDRMDVRPDHGVIKVTFKEGYWEVQIDGTSGKVLSIAQRHADWIEHIHDGSIFSEWFKIIYTNILGLGLITLALSGLWLWYGPKVIRKMK
jgi:uncharacterized iron-regulated membrane protein